MGDSIAEGAALGRARSRSRRGRLSRSAAKKLATVDQWWTDLETGLSWRIRELHRGDGARTPPVAPTLAPVVLERAGEGRRYLTFGELGRGYRLKDEAGEG